MILLLSPRDEDHIGYRGISVLAQDDLAQKQYVGLPVLFVPGGVYKHVEAVLHPVEGVQKVIEPANVDAERDADDRRHVAEKVAQADDADGGGHAVLTGRQLHGMR